jgi:hypothetical protein
MVIQYADFPTAPMWSPRNVNDLVLRAGGSVYLALRNPMTFLEVQNARDGVEITQPFFYPFASVAFPDPETNGYESIVFPISIVSVEHANYEGNPEIARMAGIRDIPTRGPILGNSVLGAFVGDQRYNMGPYKGPSDEEGMLQFVQSFHQEKMRDGEGFEILGTFEDVFLGWMSKLQ